MVKYIFGGLLVGALLLQGATLPGAVQAQVTERVVQINRFSVSPEITDVSQLKRGKKLVFTVKGTPKAKAFLTIPGFTDPLPMREVGPGIYRRSYTVRQGSANQYSRFANARADLKRGPNTTTATLGIGGAAVTPGQGQR